MANKMQVGVTADAVFLSRNSVQSLLQESTCRVRLRSALHPAGTPRDCVDGIVATRIGRPGTRLSRRHLFHHEPPCKHVAYAARTGRLIQCRPGGRTTR